MKSQYLFKHGTYLPKSLVSHTLLCLNKSAAVGSTVDQKDRKHQGSSVIFMERLVNLLFHAREN